MAPRLHLQEVSDLCLGKPPLKSVSISATVGEALSALKRFGESSLSVWSCDHSKKSNVDIICNSDSAEDCRCVGKVCMVDVICFLGKEENLSSPATALEAPLEVLIPKGSGLVRHLEPHDSPTSNTPINSLQVIDTENLLAVHYDDPASAVLPLISQSLVQQTSVAILDVDGKVIGEISPYTLNTCHESVAAAIATLSAGDLMAYIDCGGPPDELVQLVKERLEEKKYGAFLELMEEESMSSSSSFCSTSSDEEFGWGRRSGGGYSARLVRRSEAIVCYPWSSLVAVMVQALSHRVSYVWVVEEDATLFGTVTFASMFKVFRESLRSLA
ncbi:hypothetical protein C1H46_041764 [Malus baccata]|uniref:CBS domain-containing protein n=1 Tax=Malus baccata TaxID=106549 RepID=A0A540KEP3_MALBA|nr:hypothetical protein C1H46_041764 [Malus baccata]